MSSTSAVAVLAQGLRELRDFAEGPDGEELRQRTGLTDEQIEAALRGEHLPTREVTLALVAAWEGDVEGWREYWGQIAELAEDDEAADTPAPPEPSIITPIPEQEAEQPEETEPTPQTQEAARPAEAKTAAAASAIGEVAHPSAAETKPPAQAAGAPKAEPARAEQGIAAEMKSAAASPESAHQRPAAPTRPKRSPMASIGIPIVLFALGVTVGAFGDHALNSKQTSATTAASLPAVTGSSSPSHARTSSAPSSATSSSLAATPSSSAPTGGPTSASTSSTVTPGTALGTYVGIQLASGYSVNFLADAYHPAAGTADGPDTMGFFASSFVDGRFYADRVAILDPTDTGSFTSCLNDTRYQHDVLLSQIANGSSFCVTTSTGHLVLVTVRRMPSSTDANPYAVLDVTVWQGS